MQTDNYFDQPSKYSPLLHTWTLSVEEQFYIFFPIFIIFVLRLYNRARKLFVFLKVSKRDDIDRNENNERILIGCILFSSALSFLFNVWFVNIHPNAGFSLPFISEKLFSDTTFATVGFYLLPARAWELGVGALVALLAIRVRSKAKAEVLGFAGLVAIFAAVFLFDDKTNFPGIAALVPTLGAAAFIIAIENDCSASGKILSYPRLVWIGLISYSLYLWHWPILVFARVILTNPISALTMSALILLSVIISWISFRFVETPIIRKTFITTRKNTFIFGISALAFLVFAGILIQKPSFQATSRISPAAKKILLTIDESKARDGVCFPSVEDKGEYQGLCRIGDNTRTKVDFVLWGDSHADAAVPLFVELGWRYGAQGSVFAHADCAPMIGIKQSGTGTDCVEQNNLAMKYIRDHNIKNIFLVARWSNYVMEGDKKVPTAFLSIDGQRTDSHLERAEAFKKYLVPMIKELAREGRNIYIVKQAPEQFDYDPRTQFYRITQADDIGLIGTRSSENGSYQALTNAVIESLVDTHGLQIIDPSIVLCKDGICDLMRDGNLLYRDENHLSVPGVMKLEPLLQSAFENVHL